MPDLNPLSSYDSCGRIQELWELLQRDIVELEAETDQPNEQIWSDFLIGDPVYLTCFFKDFLELFYITRSVINERNDDDITRLINQIESWRDAVKRENRDKPDRRKIDIQLVWRGVQLFREYEKVMQTNGLVTVVNKNKAGHK
jgi:hypothetical protein